MSKDLALSQDLFQVGRIVFSEGVSFSVVTSWSLLHLQPQQENESPLSILYVDEQFFNICLGTCPISLVVLTTLLEKVQLSESKNMFHISIFQTGQSLSLMLFGRTMCDSVKSQLMKMLRQGLPQCCLCSLLVSAVFQQVCRICLASPFTVDRKLPEHPRHSNKSGSSFQLDSKPVQVVTF